MDGGGLAKLGQYYCHELIIELKNAILVGPEKVADIDLATV